MFDNPYIEEVSVIGTRSYTQSGSNSTHKHYQSTHNMENLKDFPEFAERMANYTPYPTDMFDVERKFDERTFNLYMQENWTRSIYYSAIYVSLVFLGKHYMKDRPRFELRVPLAMWSAGLAIFSIMGMFRSLPEFLYLLLNFGYRESVCNPAYTYLAKGATPFWSYLFIASKLMEFGDTAFIVLRKQPLIFLHWWHHITVMLYSWWSFTDFTAPARWFMAMNYAVHSLMYSYYALRAMRFRLPRWVSILITSLQILQMIMGIVLNVSSYLYKSNGHACHQTYKNIFFGLGMYLSYFALFSHFFYNSYLKAKSSKQKSMDQNANSVQTNGVAKSNGTSVKNGIQKLNGIAKKSQ